MWQDIPAYWQDFLIFCGYLLPVVLLGIFLLYRLKPWTIIKTLLQRYKKINLLIITILGICLAVSISIKATTDSYKTAMAKVANRFELVVTAPGSKTDMMLSTVYLQPVATPLLMGDVYQKIALDEKVEVAAPIAYGDSFNGFPVVGSTNSFIQYLTENKVEGSYFNQIHEAVVGAGVNLEIGDTFTPEHGIGHKTHNQKENDEAQHEESDEHKFMAHHHKEETAEHSKHSKENKKDPVFCPDGVESTTEASLVGKVFAKDEQSHSKELFAKKAQQPTAHEHEKEHSEGKDEEHKHPLGHFGHNIKIKVVGKMPITNSPWDKAIITPVESVWKIHGLPTGHAKGDNSLGEPFDMDNFAGTPAILVHPKKRFQAYSLSNKYTSSQSMAFMPPTVLAKLNSQLDDMTDILSKVSFATIALVLSLAVVTIALLGKLFEKHFKLLKSLGSPKRFIISIMWGYVTLLALGATVVGVVFGYLLSAGLASFIESKLSVLLQVTFGWQELILCAIFFALTSLVGLIPALAVFNSKSK